MGKIIKEIDLERRHALKTGVGILGSLGALFFSRKSLAEICQATPAQTLGPFYPIDRKLDEDADLTVVKGKSVKASGDVVYITGVVQNSKCEALENAQVEIWQACKTGRYDHKGDTNPAPKDPNFQYWGSCTTGKDGKYTFKTIVPGAYPADENWMRPPHIHFRVVKKGYHELVTQMYFEGEKYNASDLILQALSKLDQKQVVIKLEAPVVGMDPQAKLANFNLTLR